MASRDVVICSPVRTAIGTYGGTLKDLPAADLGAVAIRASLDRAKLSPDAVGSVVMGNVIQAGNKMNPARQAAINGGIPVAVPALTVNRVCGSGAQAIASAAQEVMLGFIDSAVAGGMENMDRAPYLMGSGRHLGICRTIGEVRSGRFGLGRSDKKAQAIGSLTARFAVQICI